MDKTGRKLLAKLRTKIDELDDHFTVYVYDDEELGEEPIMWLKADVDTHYVYVSVVDFDDELLFDLPQERQDRCALALFRAFLNYYNTHYGKDSGNWLPVYANFANYKLQEKFKQAVEKGIFPPESLEWSKFTTEEEWQNNERWNIDLRRRSNDRDALIRSINAYPDRYFNLNVQGGLVRNTPIAEILNAVDNLVDAYPFLNDPDYDDTFDSIKGTISDGNVYFRLPFVDLDYVIYGMDFDYSIRRNAILFFGYERKVIEEIKADPANVRTVFEEILDAAVNGYDFNIPSLNDFIDTIESQEATPPRTAFKRLIKSYGS